MTKKQGTIADFIRYYSFVKSEDACNWIVLTINPRILDHDQILTEVNSPMAMFPQQKVICQSLKKLRDVTASSYLMTAYSGMRFRWTSTLHHILLVVDNTEGVEDAER